MHDDILRLHNGMLCMSIGILCMHVGILCMHVGLVCSMDAMLETLCMLNLTQITPHTDLARLTHAYMHVSRESDFNSFE